MPGAAVRRTSAPIPDALSRTRPLAACRSLEKRTLADFAERLDAAVRVDTDLRLTTCLKLATRICSASSLPNHVIRAHPKRFWDVDAERPYRFRGWLDKAPPPDGTVRPGRPDSLEEMGRLTRALPRRTLALVPLKFLSTGD